MTITVLKNNAPWGPFTRAQIDEGLGRHDFTLLYLAHAPGLKEWLPLGEVIHYVDRGLSLPPVPVSPNLPPAPKVAVVPPGISERVSALPQPPVSASVPPSPAQPPPLQKPEARLPTAPFFPRAMAFLIDCAILFGPILLLFGLSALLLVIQGWWTHADPETMRQKWDLLDRNLRSLLLLVATGFGWLYAAGMECSTRQATIGKIWMGIQVTDPWGGRIGFLRATGRHWSKFLSAFPCFLGFLLALFNPRGLTLHDRLAHTRVVRV